MNTEKKNPYLAEIHIDALIKGPNHPRQDLGNLTNLTASIKKQGFMTPPVVAKIEKEVYHVIDGDRRIEIAKNLGIESVTCFVYEGLSEAEIAQKSYILNTERNQLNDIERGLHIQKMIEDFGYTSDDLTILGYGSKGTISRLRDLTVLPEKIKKNIINGDLTMAHGTGLRKLKDEKQMLRTAKLAIDNEWSAKKLEATVERLNRKVKGAGKKDTPKAVSDAYVPGIYLKDARDMIELDKESVDSIFTSPPFNVGMENEQGVNLKEHLENVKAVLKECSRVLVPGGIIAINVGNIHYFKGKKGNDKTSRILPMLHIYDSCLRKYGFHLQDEIIWKKDDNCFTQDYSVNYTDKTSHTGYRIVNRHEPIYIFKKKGERPVPSDENVVLQSRITRKEWERYAPSVWEISPAPKNQGHPSVFPDELARRIIKMYSYVGETVLDPFLGSGTTVKVARELGRDGIGYERDLRYKAAIMKKLGIPEAEVKKDPVPKSYMPAQKVRDRFVQTAEKQGSEPKVEIMASEGMLEAADKIMANQATELEHA